MSEHSTTPPTTSEGTLSVTMAQDNQISKHEADEHPTSSPTPEAKGADSTSPTTTKIDVKSESEPEEKKTEIYDLYTENERLRYLIIMSCASLLLPFTDTLYLPSIAIIQTDLHTTATLVSATVSAFSFAVGVFPLFWGPLSDFWGRKSTIFLSLIFFLVSSILCYISWDIGSLIGFRALQAAGVSSAQAVGAGVIADTYRIENRGKAMGIFGIPTLLGPVIGPLLGGIIAEYLGWRATFLFLVGFGVLILFSIMALVPETFPHFVVYRDAFKWRFLDVLSTSAKRQEAVQKQKDNLVTQKPTFIAPWAPLVFFKELSIFLLGLNSGMFFVGLYVAVVVYPDQLVAHYGLRQIVTGACFLPLGVGAMLGSQIGGVHSDRFMAKYLVDEARLITVIIGNIISVPALLAFGWTLARTHVAAPIIFMFPIGFGLCYAMPGFMTYAIQRQPMNASAIIGALQFAQFVLSAVGIIVSTVIAAAIGYGFLFTILAGLIVVTAIPLFFAMKRGLAKSPIYQTTTTTA